MSNPLELLTRLFKRNPANAVIAEIYGKAMNQPLFIHPAIGEMIVHGYLHSDISQLQGDAGRRGHNQSEASVGILDISGALVARETLGPCGPGPLSYEEIRAGFDQLMSDPAIQTIIGRFDSPGGMAAQNLDLVDFIYASRGQGKRLIAMVDDMAYSAAYALASAFDEIWITRTGGVGSVGVVSYHLDQSEYDKKLGVRIDYIYAGARKVDGNPHGPLSDPARARFEGEIARLYNLFTATVARNLGLSVDAVKQTEANTFNGEQAVKAGFAHQVGTFSDLLLSLMPAGENRLVTVTMEDPSLLSEANRLSPGVVSIGTQPIHAPGAIAQPERSEDGSHFELSTDEKEALPEAMKKQQRNEEIRALCTAARRPEAALHYLNSGLTVQQVRADLMTLLASGQREINGAAPVTLVNNPAEQSKNGWAAAFQKAKHLN